MFLLTLLYTCYIVINFKLTKQTCLFNLLSPLLPVYVRILKAGHQLFSSTSQLCKEFAGTTIRWGPQTPANIIIYYNTYHLFPLTTVSKSHSIKKSHRNQVQTLYAMGRELGWWKRVVYVHARKTALKRRTEATGWCILFGMHSF